VHRRIAEVGRTPSDSEKRVDRYVSGRKPAPYTKRVNGSLTANGARARKRKGPLAAKGGRFFEARRSSSRERRDGEEGFAVSLVPRRERGARRDCRRKTPWTREAYAFHEAPAEPVLAAFELRCWELATAPTPRLEGGDKGVRGDRSNPVRRNKTPPRTIGRRRSETRVVKRVSPQRCLLIRTARPRANRCLSLAFQRRARQYAKTDVRVDEHGAESLR
jgi:hypothetical protein